MGYTINYINGLFDLNLVCSLFVFKVSDDKSLCIAAAYSEAEFRSSLRALGSRQNNKESPECGHCAKTITLARRTHDVVSWTTKSVCKEMPMMLSIAF
jgi:hypothetical protein